MNLQTHYDLKMGEISNLKMANASDRFVLHKRALWLGCQPSFMDCPRGLAKERLA
jgi:hypothetical protein